MNYVEFLTTALMLTDITSYNLTQNYTGPERVVTSDGSRGNNVFRLHEQPEPSSANGLAGWFEHVTPFSYDTFVTGRDTVRRNPNGYSAPDETSTVFHGAVYESGYNGYPLTGVSSGRTGWSESKYKLIHNGKGDAGIMHMSAFAGNGSDIDGINVPATVLLNGQITAGADNVYFNPMEFLFKDNGYDILVNGRVDNYHRSIDSGNNNYWDGNRQQCLGPASCDSAFVPVGYWKYGYDSTGGIGGIDMALKAGDRIYLDAKPKISRDGGAMHAQVDNETYISFEDGAIQMVVDGMRSLSVGKGPVGQIAKQPNIPYATGCTALETLNSILDAMMAAGIIEEGVKQQ